MSLVQWCTAINILAMWPIVFWVWAKPVLVWLIGRDAASAYRAELRPFVWPLYAVAVVADVLSWQGHIQWWGVFLNAFAGFGVASAWSDKDDDDRWKRRRKKLADKVAEVGGKLVLVPAGSPP